MTRPLALALALALAGCGAQDAAAPAPAPSPRPAAATPANGPVAYVMPRSAAPSLGGADPFEQAEGFAESEWEGYPAIVLIEWLGDRGIDLEEPPDLRRVSERLAREQELPLVFIAPEHRRFAARLDRLRPSDETLQRFSDRIVAIPLDL